MKCLFYLLLNLIKIAIAKNINNTPITIRIILIIFVIVEVFEFSRFETLLTVEELGFCVEFVVVLFELELFAIFDWLAFVPFDDVLFDVAFPDDEVLFAPELFWAKFGSVKFKSIA